MFDPNLQSNLKSEKAQGANVGDIRQGYRWDGNNWTAEQGGGGNGNDVFNTAKSALQQRYDSLITSLKGQQQTETNRQQVTTQNELGKRGILPSSGVAQQEVTNALNPITSNYSGLMANAQGQYNTDVSNLAIQQYQGQQQANQFGQTLGLQKSGQDIQLQQLQNQISQQAIANALSQKQLGISGGNLAVAQSNSASENALRQAQINSLNANPASDLNLIRNGNQANPINYGKYTS